MLGFLAVVLIGRITVFARPSVRHIRTLNFKKGAEKNENSVNVLRGRCNRCGIDFFQFKRSKVKVTGRQNRKITTGKLLSKHAKMGLKSHFEKF